MTGLKATKRALLSSVIALFLCFAMLLGTTYAWFTDSASSTGNKIVSGNLDVELYQWTSATESKNISDSKDPVFTGEMLWEPGKTEVVYFSIKNAGNLDLKYKTAVVVTSVSEDSLTDVMSYTITPDAKYGDVTAWAGNGTYVELGINATNALDVPLTVGGEHFFALSVHMDETATNEYMGETITFDIMVLAGQLASENDSFNNQYDKDAVYPPVSFSAPVIDGQVAVSIEVRGEDGYKNAAFEIPTTAVASGAKSVTVTVVESEYDGNITIAADQETTVYEVTVEGLKENNDVPVKVMLKAPVGLDPNTVKLYHYDDEVTPITYNPHTGYITFESLTFSPFTIVYDAESSYDQPEVVLPEGCPTASVTRVPTYENTDLDWGSYGQWSPTEGLDSQLKAAYSFVCIEDLDQAKENKYANWYCDFYVMLDKDLGENQIFLGGNYGSFGWVGFHNGDLTLEANTEIPLLGSVTTNPWTYLDVVQNVGTFICGVGDVDNALTDATFTVMLRLTNPENEAEFYNVATINYTFEAN